MQCYLVRALRRFLYLAHLAVHSANTYSPLQAPQAAIDRHGYIKDEDRRPFSGMLYKLDESVGKVDTIDILAPPCVKPSIDDMLVGTVSTVPCIPSVPRAIFESK